MSSIEKGTVISRSHSNIRLFLGGLGLAAASLLTNGISASATPDSAPAPKVFVCKYVGEPGVAERLQTGQNPISVSSHAIKGYAGIGSSFNDRQGRSLVVAEDYGQAEPDCPAPLTTPPVIVVPGIPRNPNNPGGPEIDVPITVDAPGATPVVATPAFTG